MRGHAERTPATVDERGAHPGIHGTNSPGSIGGYVSYGCIRMHNADVLDLYGRVGFGTPHAQRGRPRPLRTRRLRHARRRDEVAPSSQDLNARRRGRNLVPAFRVTPWRPRARACRRRQGRGACGVMPNGRPRRLMNAVRIPADPCRARAAPGGWRGDRQKSEDQPHAKGTCPSAAPSPTSCDRLCRIASVFEGILIALRCSSPIAPKFRHCSNSTRCAKTGRETGRREVVADDARAREVALRHSSYEADEQGGAIRCGAIRGGANRCGAGERNNSIVIAAKASRRLRWNTSMSILAVRLR